MKKKGVQKETAISAAQMESLQLFDVASCSCSDFNLPLSLTDWFHGFYPARVRKSMALKILVSAAD